MILRYTRLKVADNTGARQLMCIGIMGGSGKKYARVGDVITGAVKKATPGGQGKKGRNLAQTLAQKLRSQAVPVVGRVSEDVLLLDPRSVLPEEDEMVLQALKRLASQQ